MDNQPKKQHRPLKALFYGLITGFLLIGAVGEVYVGYKLVHGPAVLNASTQQSNANLNPGILSAKPGLQTFVSQKFHYGFYYQPQGNSLNGMHETFNVSELDSGMVVFTESLTQEPSRIIEAFQKDPADTLDVAIKKEFFNDFSPIGCRINSVPDQLDKHFPGSLIVANITSVTTSQDIASATPTIACPSPYIQVDPVHPRFFLMDPKNPAAFLFINASQSSALTATTDSGEIISWFDTITFIH